MSDEKLILKLPVSNEDFLVEVNKCVFLFSPELTEHADVDESGITTWYFPYSAGSYEVRIISEAVDSPDTSKQDQIHIVLVTGEQTITVPLIYKEVMFADTFPIFAKSVDDDWQGSSIEQSQYGERLLSEEESVSLGNLGPDIFHLKPFKKRSLALFSAIGLVLIVTSILIWKNVSVSPHVSQERRITELSSKLEGATSPLIYLAGKDGEIIVLVQSQRELDWVKQRLQQEQLAYSVTVKKQSSQESELENALVHGIPGLLKINLSVPCEPQIEILDPSDNAIQENDLLSFVQNAISERFYCDKLNLNFHHHKAEKLLSDAKLGIELSNLPWIIQGDKTAPIFIIDAQLNDQQTISAIHFIEEFRRKYGTNYIKFSLSLTKNQLLGKSFLNTKNGYILLDRNHWYFNSTVK